MGQVRRRSYTVAVALGGIAFSVALATRHQVWGQAASDTDQSTAAMRMSPAQLEKKYEQYTQLLVTPDYLPRKVSDSDAREAKQFLSSVPVVALSPYVEGHAHPNGPTMKTPTLFIENAFQLMERVNAVKVVMFPSPYAPEDKIPYSDEDLARAVKGHEDKFAFLGGGTSLNPMMLEAVRVNNTGPDTQRKVKELAEKLLSEGAVGFSELTPEHLAVASTQSYMHMPPDNPLMLVLADVAAQHGVPMLIHMEALMRSGPMPDDLNRPPNPSQITENITGLERLLSHNPRATIVWAHAGLDNTGDRTPDLMRRLLKAHPNLYMDVKIVPARLGKNSPFDADGKIKPDWLRLFQDFPDRFMLGSDQGYGGDPKEMGSAQGLRTSVLMVNQLPKNLALKIGNENAQHVYHFSSGSKQEP